MSRKDKRKQSKINPETKNSIFAVFLTGLSAILILAAADKAGPAGSLSYAALNSLFGWGYYLLPTMAFLVATMFFFSKQKVFITTSFVGATIFVLSGLGLIDIVFENRGGLVGNVIGLLEIPFGHIAAIVMSLVILAIALLITFNASIKLKKSNDEKENEKAGAVGIPADWQTSKNSDPAENESETPTSEDAKIEEDPTIAPDHQPTEGSKKSASKPRAFSNANYVAPPLSLLKASVEKPTSGDLRANANIIKRTMESFGIPVEMGEINIGPKVTRYTLKPAEGVKLSKISALSPDLALALAAHPIRIEAPIPGKSLVGIEVPNKSAAIVRLGSLLAYPETKDSGPLAVVLGRSVSGEPIIADIEKMPHLLVAGSTGSGKSVAIHSLLVSLIAKNSPATLRLILIDPKRVELSVYGGLPHLIAPVVTEGKKSIALFRWAIKEMERRYEVLLSAGARDIGSYNQKNEELMPYILLVVDELADLMAAYGREIESSIVRLAQMARATGIHLIVSTQRPSVEVITGLIKANITARVALQVASQVDSRTILDMAGAEKLLGGGDMLFISSDFSKPKRIQGAYISEEEIKKVAEFIEENNEPAELAEANNGESFGSNLFENSEEEVDDELYQEAVQVIAQAQKASASLLQRRLKVGYARAARLLDIMEEKGVVGPGEGAKPREVFIDKESSDIT